MRALLAALLLVACGRPPDGPCAACPPDAIACYPEPDGGTLCQVAITTHGRDAP